MKKTAILTLFALISIFLIGCQAEKEAAEAEETTKGTEEGLSDTFLVEGEIAKIELSEIKGIDPVIFEEGNELKTLKSLFSSAKKQPGIVNMSAPEFYLKVVMEDGDKRYLNLWIGGEGEMASLMDMENTHTIYTMAPNMKSKLTGLIEKRVNRP